MARVAMIPGTDLADEYVILGAHYDHVGYGSKENSNGAIGTIHNGADDNASGVVVLLLLAELLAIYDRDLTIELVAAR